MDELHAPVLARERLEPRVREVEEGLGIEALVAVGHVDGQHAADVREVGGHTRVRVALEVQRAALPAAHGAHERQLGGMAVLTEDVDLVAHIRERRGQARVVDVAARTAQQVAVEDENPHWALLSSSVPTCLQYGAPDPERSTRAADMFPRSCRSARNTAFGRGRTAK